MNQHSAYLTCHELMLLNPSYVARENQGVSYILIQISETDDDVGIQAHIIDPQIPQKGSPTKFIGLPEHKQMVVSALPRIHNVLKEAHEMCNKLQLLRRRYSDDTDAEFVKRMKDKFEER